MPDMISVVCPVCKRKIVAPSLLAGKEVKCPHGDHMVPVPLGDADAPSAAPTRPANLERKCPRCGQVALLKPADLAKVVTCPVCRATIPPNISVPSGKRKDLVFPAAGWMVSVALHAVLLIVCVLITWFPAGGSGDGTDDGGMGAGVANEGQSITSGEADLQPMASPTAEMAPVATDEVATADSIDLPSASDSPADSISDSLPKGIAGGSKGAEGDGGWGIPGGGTGSGIGSFMGHSMRGGSFVYVIDHSGSMAGDKIEFTKNELIKSIMKLNARQKFFVIFYDDMFITMPASGLVKADKANKDKYIEWIRGIDSGGGTKPVPAVLKALSLKPNGIWLMSDGEFYNADQEAQDIRRANPDAKVHIHTIAFHDPAGEPILKRIAKENRGEYSFVPPPP